MYIYVPKLFWPDKKMANDVEEETKTSREII